MNWQQLILPILSKTNIVLLAISTILVVFFWFFIKARFKQNPDLKYYAILFYAFSTLLIASVSYLVLNAQSVFFNFNNIYITYWFYIVYIALGGFFGGLIGWLIHKAAMLVNPVNAYQLINFSLIIIAPTMLYILLFKPFIANFEYVGLKETTVYKPNNLEENIYYNPYNFTKIKTKPKAVFTPAVPIELYDSLLITLHNANSINITLKNGFSFSHNLKNNNLQQLYAINAGPYLAVLATSDRVSNLSSLILIDNTGNMAFLKTFNNGVNRLATSTNGKYVLLNQSADDNQNAIKFIEALALN